MNSIQLNSIGTDPFAFSVHKIRKECNAIPYLLHDYIENLHATLKYSRLPFQVDVYFVLLMESYISFEVLV